LGLWIEQTKGAKIWLKVFNELKTRGCQDILIAGVDGLKGLAEATGTEYPRTTVQTCIVHLIRNSMEYADWKDRKDVAQALRPDLCGLQRAGAQEALQAFADGPWGAKYPSIVQSWQRAWEHVTPFFVFPLKIRRVVYTTDEIGKPPKRSFYEVRVPGHNSGADLLDRCGLLYCGTKLMRPTHRQFVRPPNRQRHGSSSSRGLTE
jgi:transposase-like protein